MRIILVSNLYPNSKEPMRALYNSRLFRALHGLGYELEVIAPLPWFPGKRGLPPKVEQIDGVSISHPRYFYTPGFAIHHHWRFYSLAVRSLLRRRVTVSEEPVHVVLGFVYADAVAMAPVCEALCVSYSVLVLGSDFRVRMRQVKFKSMVEQCLMQAPHVFCPGSALRRDMISAGLPSNRVHAFNNGVDSHVFYYNELSKDMEHRKILFVGNLVEVKAPSRLLRAFALALPDLKPSLHLSFIGEGPLRASLANLAEQLGIADKVTWLGRRAPEIVAEHMRSALGLCLCSRSEGMPNVVIEALACGCPVVATAVGEVPHLVESGRNGFDVKIDGRDEAEIVADLAVALQNLSRFKFDRALIAAGVSDFTWEAAARVLAGVISSTEQPGKSTETLQNEGD